MPEQITCDCCNQPMKLESQLKNGVTRDGSQYRKRRFKCELCNLTKMVYSDGQKDDVLQPYNAQKAVEKLYQQQQSNNDDTRITRKTAVDN